MRRKREGRNEKMKRLRKKRKRKLRRRKSLHEGETCGNMTTIIAHKIMDGSVQD